MNLLPRNIKSTLNVYITKGLQYFTLQVQIIHTLLYYPQTNKKDYNK